MLKGYILTTTRKLKVYGFDYFLMNPIPGLTSHNRNKLIDWLIENLFEYRERVGFISHRGDKSVIVMLGNNGVYCKFRGFI